jgi:hypothetical protein
MVRNYKRIKLPQDSIKFLRSRLLDGKTLAKLISQNQCFNGGQVTTLIPKWLKIAEKDLKDFETGILPDPPPETHMKVEGGIAVPIPDDIFPFLINEICEFLNGDRGNICIFEEGLALPSDTYFKHLSLPYSLLGNEIYYYVSRDDIDNKIVDKVVWQARNFYPGLIGVMTHVSAESFLEEGKISLDHLRTLADNAEKIILGAYDGEGYLLMDLLMQQS